MRVTRFKLHRAETKASVSFHPAAVVENHRFRQARGARRVNVEKRVFAVDTVDCLRIMAGRAARFRCQIAEAGRGAAFILKRVGVGEVVNRVGTDVEVFTHFAERLQQFFANNGRARFHQIETVREYLAGLLRVQHRVDRADLRAAGDGSK
jgi:hypothetical protein